MTDRAAEVGAGTDGAPGDGDWYPVLDQLIAGVSHQLSNRIATLAGVSDLLAGDPTIPPILRALSEEVPRLEESLRLLRLLTVPDGEGEEPLEPARIVHDALALARVHPASKGAAFDVVLPPSLPPVLAAPTRAVHRVAAALVRAGARAPGAVIRVRAAAAGREVSLSIDDAAPIRLAVLAAARQDTSPP